ncbi:MAG TPA: RNA polymerase sigma factor [Actinomycetota bacterium]|nr:RNA polymerase sigma factor [Actinomycetota bacterium]
MGGRPLEEEELVERARNGDVTAYEQLVRTYQDLAARTAYVITGGAADAQDAAQEAFVKAYYSLGRFRAGAPFRPWLLRIVANEAINRRRSTRRQAGLALRAAEGRLQDDAVPSPEGAALAQDEHRRLVAAMNLLRAEDRLVIAYRYWFDLSESEMADALGCARGTVKSKLSRALARLRKVMAPAGLGDERVGLEGATDG